MFRWGIKLSVGLHASLVLSLLLKEETTSAIHMGMPLSMVLWQRARTPLTVPSRSHIGLGANGKQLGPRASAHAEDQVLDGFGYAEFWTETQYQVLPRMQFESTWIYSAACKLHAGYQTHPRLLGVVYPMRPLWPMTLPETYRDLAAGGDRATAIVLSALRS